MTVIKSLFIAFSIYSKIPVPQFEWKEEEMKYMLCFFPWVGAAAGGLVYLWGMFCRTYQVGSLCYTLFGAAISLLVTGGFHADGFLDTMDAFHSYRPKEKKLEILKDSHIGAFAVIMFGLYGLLYMAAFSEICDSRLLGVVSAGFFLSRTLSGIGVVTFPPAKQEGLLFLFSGSAQKNMVKAVLILQGIVCIGFMLWCSPAGGAAAVIAAFYSFAAYWRRCKKELGGTTGDTAGYFVMLCEVCMVVAVAAVSILGKGGPG